MRKLAIAAAALLSACGGPPPDGAPLAIVVQSTAPWASEPDLVERAEARVALALAYWEAPPEVLDGWTLTVADFEDVRIACMSERAGGCTIGGQVRELWVSTSFGPCVEATPIAHEVGHVVLGAEGDSDGDHSDPRWSGLLEAGLAAGYRACP